MCRWLTNFYRKPSIYIFLKNRKIWVFKFLTKKKMVLEFEVFCRVFLM